VPLAATPAAVAQASCSATASPASPSPSTGPSAAATSSPSAAATGAQPSLGFPTLRDFTQAEHGYRLHLPPGWNLHAPSGPHDTADVRFGVLPGCRGFVQYYEGATTYSPTSWYLMARQRYTQAVAAHPTMGKLAVSPLTSLDLGGRPAHQFDMTTTTPLGEQAVTRVVFAIGSGPEGRIDVLELFVLATPEEMRERDAEVHQLLSRFEWLEPEKHPRSK
jgi:hypothetical protein